MQTKTGAYRVGYSWRPKPGVLPGIISASYYSALSWRCNVRHMHAVWVLDYSLSLSGVTRVGSPHAPWQERGPRVAHLYAPGISYWEDSTSQKLVRGAFVIFSGGAETGLDALTGKLGYARILDPDGRLELPFQAAARAGFDQGESGYWQAQSALCCLFSAVLRARHLQNDLWTIPAVSTASLDLVQQAQSFMRKNLHRRIAIADIASDLHMSVSSFAHRYRKETGEAPGTTLM